MADTNSKNTIRVGILFGGRSAEHEVSLQSAKNVIDSIDRKKFEVVLIGIDREGRWYLNENTNYLLNQNNPEMIRLENSKTEIALTPTGENHRLIKLQDSTCIKNIDVLFPVLHGPYGEDGSIQGLAKLANIPCVGAGILGSAIGMDKDIMKRLLRDANIAIAKFVSVNRHDILDYPFEKIKNSMGLPFFVKPANMGSSIGVTKVETEKDYSAAIKKGFEYDLKVMIEEFINGREIECSILGNDEPICSIPGEIIPNEDYYSYRAKYIDEQGALLEVPAKLTKKITEEIQELSIRAYKALSCSGMARIDMFLTPNEKIVVNEINTIPGFTKISMYPKLWEYSGIGYSELIERLITLAIEDFKQRSELKTTVEI